MQDYHVFSSDLIKSRLPMLVHELDMAHMHFKQAHPDRDSTWAYHHYNTFNITSPSIHFYQLFKELTHIIRLYAGNERPLWLQCWINYHRPDEVLDWHTHEWPFHGYISIDPKNTTTEFENYSVENRVGNIYIGPGHRKHRVVVNEPYDGYRITLGFDVTDEAQPPTPQMSLIPI